MKKDLLSPYTVYKFMRLCPYIRVQYIGMHMRLVDVFHECLRAKMQLAETAYRYIDKTLLGDVSLAFVYTAKCHSIRSCYKMAS